MPKAGRKPHTHTHTHTKNIALAGYCSGKQRANIYRIIVLCRKKKCEKCMRAREIALGF